MLDRTFGAQLIDGPVGERRLAQSAAADDRGAATVLARQRDVKIPARFVAVEEVCADTLRALPDLFWARDLSVQVVSSEIEHRLTDRVAESGQRGHGLSKMRLQFLDELPTEECRLGVRFDDGLQRVLDEEGEHGYGLFARPLHFEPRNAGASVTAIFAPRHPAVCVADEHDERIAGKHVIAAFGTRRAVPSRSSS